MIRDMDDIEVGRYWDKNADAWTTMSRAGYDIYRDTCNTPAFIEFLPDVKNLDGLDIGCGEGTNTRQVAQLGARMTGIDISPRFIAHAMDVKKEVSPAPKFMVASAQKLPFPDESFDFCTAFMSLMDIPNQLEAFKEIKRVLKPGGFLQFSITHPCFDTPHRRNLRDESGKTYAIEVGRYFEQIDGRIDRWSFGNAPAEIRAKFPQFEVPRFHRTISDWINVIIESGLSLERLSEPRATEEQAKEIPAIQDTRVVAYFLHVRCRKL